MLSVRNNQAIIFISKSLISVLFTEFPKRIETTFQK